MTQRDQANKMLKASISRFLSFTDDECTRAASLFQQSQLARKEHWLLPGNVCSRIAFIVKGCLRCYYTNDGRERTGQFFFEGDWFTDYESYLTRRPSIVGADAVEPTELLVISIHDLEHLYELHPKFERLGRLIAENMVISIRRRNISLLSDSPEESYLRLLKEWPGIIARIPQHMIASFLGIKPESLSRIRKKITLKASLRVVS
jgi:CRP-like cAMP-binding protein